MVAVVLAVGDGEAHHLPPPARRGGVPPPPRRGPPAIRFKAHFLGLIPEEQGGSDHNYPAANTRNKEGLPPADGLNGPAQQGAHYGRAPAQAGPHQSRQPRLLLRRVDTRCRVAGFTHEPLSPLPHISLGSQPSQSAITLRLGSGAGGRERSVPQPLTPDPWPRII